MLPDWQLPPGVDRGLWDYLHAGDMVAGYDAQVRSSALAAADVALCDRVFPKPLRFVDLGCGTGRLAVHLARRGFDCVGVDLSEAMLKQARANADAAGVTVDWRVGNLTDLAEFPADSFGGAACLFSTLGMVRGSAFRLAAAREMARILEPGAKLVVHAHNRRFAGLTWRRVLGHGLRALLNRPDAGDVTMPQSYAGAPLTLRHFTRGELVGLLRGVGLAVEAVERVRLPGAARWGWGRTYGFLAVARKEG